MMRNFFGGYGMMDHASPFCSVTWLCTGERTLLMPTRRRVLSVIPLLIALILIVASVPPAPVGATRPPEDQYFPQTSHAVNDEFLRYWNTHGALAQQGY